MEETQSIVEEEEEEGELQDCGLVPGETYRIGINQLQLPDGRVISNWRMCQLQEGIRFSVQYEESTPEASVEPDPQADKTPTPPAQVQPALDSSPQAAAVGRMGAFLAKHPEVILMEARVTAPCLVDGSADPIGRSAAEDLVARVSTLGVEVGRISVREMPCSAGTRSVRIEAVVVRAQPVNDAPKQ